jgi:sulfur relay (sulfurtransferase) DsrC/TusE family protein
MYTITTQLEGDWQGATNELGTLDSKMRKAIQAAQRSQGQKLMRIVRNHILNQDLNWPDLAYPEKSGDPRILIDTEAYLNAITEWQENLIHYIGVKQDATNGRGEKISFYAYLLEYGWISRGGNSVPPRPLWQPSINEMGGPEGWTAKIREEMIRKFKPLADKGFEIR